MKDRSLQKDQRILQAARILFLEQGFRGTTMERIAQSAGVAKPTLYAYYPDKEQVFRAVIAVVIDDMKKTVEEALKKPESPEQKIALAFCSKYAYVAKLMDGSPHAQELMNDKLLYAGKEFADLRLWLQQKIALTLREAGRQDAEEMSQLLIACADGLHSAANHMEVLSDQITYVTTKLLSRDQLNRTIIPGN